MRRISPVIVALLACALWVSGSTAASPDYSPSVTSVRPLNLRVGQTLTITGKRFLPGSGRNTVVFARSGTRAVFVRGGVATTTRLRIVVPNKLLPYLRRRGGRAIATKFQLRVLARRFGRSFTSLAMSPRISPPLPRQTGPGGVAPAPPVGPAAADCDGDRIPNSEETDDDNDLLSDSFEKTYKLDPCNADSDRDTVEDGFEYESAVDLNGRQSTNPGYRPLPYPAKRPYPNPLDGGDGNTDFDGDGLVMSEEYMLWVSPMGPNPFNPSPHSLPLAYSEGDQTTGDPYPVPGGDPQLDSDGNGSLSDDEKDADGDGLPNWDEIRGAFAAPAVEHMAYKPLLDFLAHDTDGDGLRDGDDDQDQDDLSNKDELQPRPSGVGYQVEHRVVWVASNSMDPCSPVFSRSCPRHPE